MLRNESATQRLWSLRELEQRAQSEVSEMKKENGKIRKRVRFAGFFFVSGTGKMIFLGIFSEPQERNNLYIPYH